MSLNMAHYRKFVNHKRVINYSFDLYEKSDMIDISEASAQQAVERVPLKIQKCQSSF